MQISSSNSRTARPATRPTASNTRLTCVFEPWQGIDPAPITARVAGRRYTAPAMNAGEWFAALQKVGWLRQWRFTPDREFDPAGLGAAAMFELLCTGAADRYRLSLAVEDGHITGAQLAKAARAVFEKAAGVSWWTAERLAVQSVSWSGIGAALYTTGMRLNVPLPVWLGAAYRTWMSLVDDDERAAADTALALPPAGYDAEVQLPTSIDELFI